MTLSYNILCKRTLPALLLILLAGTIVYSNTFHVPFVLDDNGSLVNNRAIRSPGDTLYAYNLGVGFLQNRVVTYLTFALNYQFGGLDVTGYHVVNLLIHLVTALLVYTLFRQTFRTPYLQSAGFSSGARVSGSSLFSPQCFIPLFGALLFAVHPVQTQAVTYTVQRLSSLTTMLYLLSLVLFVQARLRMQKPSDEEARSSQRVFSLILCYAGSVLAAILAMKSKEIAFTLPLAVVLFELFFFRGAWMRRLLYVLPLLATLPIIPLTVLGILDIGVDEQAAAEWRPQEEEQLRVGTAMSRLDYLFTQFRVMVTYLRLLLLPVNQNLDYNYPVYTTFFTPAVLFSFLFLLLLVACAIALFILTRSGLVRRGKGLSPGFRLISFGILWFFLTLSVESSLIPIIDVIMEHRLYLPFGGAAMALTTLCYLLVEKLTKSAKGPVLLVTASLLILALGIAAFQRNQVWGDKLGLWRDVVSKSPNKARPHNNLGKALEQAGMRAEAFQEFSKAINLDPTYYTSYYNLADLYLVSDQPEKALPLLQTAIDINPDFSDAYVSIGAALMRSGQFSEVAAFLEKNLGRVADNAEARFYLGSAYAFLGNRAAAIRELEVLSRLDASYAGTLANMIRARSHGTGHGR